ncbi:MAG: 4'-phosphopantetheinyl transferase superfamily protein [Gemmatimonadaceae bacterium]|nr:4'-phosphopantetheinyl transferase superfamily protein [Gemmatimonadaceae bacterium]
MSTPPPGAAGRLPRAMITLINLPSTVVGEDLEVLAEHERERAGRFHFEHDRAAFITTRASLRRLLAEETRLPADQLQLPSDPNGRPFWAGADLDPPAARLDFNVSHSGPVAAIGISRGRRIGVDVEWHGRQRSLRDLEDQVMGPAEKAMLRELDDAAHLKAFLACWTRKEALVKAIGLGLSYPVTTIDLPLVPPDRLVRLGEGPSDLWSILTSDEPGYTLSIAVAGSGMDVVIERPPTSLRRD